MGPYNQAILKGNTLYTSGQIALNPATGALVIDNIELKHTQVHEAVTRCCGNDLENVKNDHIHYGYE
jgi:2-iminobutanoate/2-iminopropanoate deaminase